MKPCEACDQAFPYWQARRFARARFSGVTGGAGENIDEQLPARIVEWLGERQDFFANPPAFLAKWDEDLMIHPNDRTISIGRAAIGIKAHRSPAVPPLSEGNKARLDHGSKGSQQLEQRRQGFAAGKTIAGPCSSFRRPFRRNGRFSGMGGEKQKEMSDGRLL